jgi:ATP-binding protein involved in chromosome partitioning
MEEQTRKTTKSTTKIILVASNKGGTGKTTISCKLAELLSKKVRVALLDTDVTGPNVIETLGLKREHATVDLKYFYPRRVNKNLEVFSPSMLIPDDTAITWWGAQRGKIIEELFRKVKWDNPEYLIIDSPPGTSDELLTVLMHTRVDGMIIVTLGNESAINDAKRLIAMLQDDKFSTPILGIVHNMHPLFGDGDLSELGLPVLAKVPYKDDKNISKELSKVVEVVIGN